MGLLEKIVLKWVILTLGLLLFLLPFVSSYFPSESNARLHPPFYHFICSSNSTVMVQKENKLIFRGIYTFFMSFDFHIEYLILYKGMLHFPICFSSHSDEMKNSVFMMIVYFVSNKDRHKYILNQDQKISSPHNGILSSQI